jgi:hypothetical protein
MSRTALCCPKYHVCREKPPKIKYHCVCSKPVLACDAIEGTGYYPTCWRPSGPLNYSHCQQPAPAVIAVPPSMMPDAKPVEAEGGPMPGKVSLPHRPGY